MAAAKTPEITHGNIVFAMSATVKSPELNAVAPGAPPDGSTKSMLPMAAIITVKALTLIPWEMASGIARLANIAMNQVLLMNDVRTTQQTMDTPMSTAGDTVPKAARWDVMKAVNPIPLSANREEKESAPAISRMMPQLTSPWAVFQSSKVLPSLLTGMRKYRRHVYSGTAYKYETLARYERRGPVHPS